MNCSNCSNNSKFLCVVYKQINFTIKTAKWKNLIQTWREYEICCHHFTYLYSFILKLQYHLINWFSFNLIASAMFNLILVNDTEYFMVINKYLFVSRIIKHAMKSMFTSFPLSWYTCSEVTTPRCVFPMFDIVLDKLQNITLQTQYLFYRPPPAKWRNKRHG